MRPTLTRFNTIQLERKTKKLSVAQVALYLGVDKSTIYAYEYNQIQPSDKAIRKLSQLFGVPPNKFMFYKDKLD